MGMSGIGPSELVVILLIALMIFGTKRLKTIGGDLGVAIKSFREAMNDGRIEAPARAPSARPTRELDVARAESRVASPAATPAAPSSAPEQSHQKTV